MFIDPQGNYPRHYGDIEATNPGWKNGDLLPEGWQEVAYTNPPQVGEYEVLFEEAPAFVDGVLSQVWATRPMTADEKAAKDAPKTARAKLLALGLTEAEIGALANGLVR